MEILRQLAALSKEQICKDPNIEAELKAQAGCSETGNFGVSLTAIIQTVIGLVGLMAVVAIVMGGITYATSMGETSKVKKAKDTIMYGVIGLIVAVMSFAIVSFVSASVFK